MKQKFFLTTFLSLLLSVLLAQPGHVDPTFNPSDTGFGNGLVFSGVSEILETPSGKLLIAVNSVYMDGIQRKELARINADGSLDTGLGDVLLSQYGSIYALAVLPDESILIGGYFDSVQGQPRKNFAKLLPDGSLDNQFPNFQLNNLVYSIAAQSDGKVLIGGAFTTVQGLNRKRMARINTDGSLDGSFNTGIGFSSDVNDIIVHEDDRILLVGEFTTFDGLDAKRVIRLQADGSVDASFVSGSGFNYGVYDVEMDLSGNYVCGGLFNTFNGVSAKRLARLFPDGSLDESLVTGNGFGYEVNSILVQDDGKILVSGDFSSYESNTSPYLVRVNQDGSFDSGFDVGLGLNFAASDLFQKDDGSYLLGSVYSYNDIFTCGIAHVSEAGELDLNYYPGSGASGSINEMAVQEDGKIIIAGDFTRYNNDVHRRIVRLNTDGSVDPSFNADVNDVVNALALQSDGKMYIGGLFSTVNGVFTGNLARLNSDGSLDTSFANDPDLTYYPYQPGIQCIDIQTDGRILVGGEFYYGLLRFNSDGSQDLSFEADIATEDVFDVEELIDGRILATGNISDVGFNYVTGKVMFFSDGTQDESFSMSAEYPGYFSEWPDGRIQFGKTRVLSNGSVDNTFSNPGVSGTVYDIELLPNGKILMGGSFQISQFGILRYARLENNGNPDVNFSGYTGPNGSVFALAQSGTKTYLAGEFTAIEEIGRNRVARVSNGNLSTDYLNLSQICRGDEFEVEFTTDEDYESDNVFELELSDVLGSFESPVIIGSLASTESGSITATIPQEITPAITYRLRLKSTHPLIYSNEIGNNLAVEGVDNTISVFGNTLQSNEFGATYQWYDCINDTIIPGATQNVFTPVYNGSFASTVSEDGCSGNTDCIEVIVNNLAEFGSKWNCNFYPNPVEDVLHLTYPEEAQYVRICDLSGRVMREFQVEKGNYMTHSTEYLSAGIYQVEFWSTRRILQREKLSVR